MADIDPVTPVEDVVAETNEASTETNETPTEINQAPTTETNQAPTTEASTTEPKDVSGGDAKIAAAIVAPVTISADGLTPDQAWKLLGDEKSQINWILIGLTAQKNLMVAGIGSKGLEELKERFNDGEVQFGAIRVVGVDIQANVTSRRPKFVTIQYVGTRVSSVRRGSVLKVKPDIEKTFAGSALNIQFSADITLKTIAKALLAAGGAHKPKYYECGSDKVNVADLYS